MTEPPRQYRQVARAAASQETRRRIVAAFSEALYRRWMDEITLDDVAASAGTTRQTVIRLFGGKEGLLAAMAEQTGIEVSIRRSLPPAPTPLQIARAVVRDYEVNGEMIFRLLAQEERYPVLSALLEIGRGEHRQWVARTFAHLADCADTALLDQLILATDVYSWKLLRVDFKRSVEQTETSLATIIEGILTIGRTR